MPEGEDHWELFFGAAFIVEPSKGLEPNQASANLRGSSVEVASLPRDFFLSLFEESINRYPIEVVFSPQGPGQANAVRDIIRSVVLPGSRGREDAARKLALRLAACTDQRSPTGLLVLLAGRRRDTSRLVIWKFPADQALQASMVGGVVKIRLIEGAFSRESTYFKAAVFEGPEADTSFWDGKVEDKQAKQRVEGAAEFWTTEFLTARPTLTDAHGTRVVAKALKYVLKKAANAETMEEIAAAARVLATQHARNHSIADVADNYLPETTRQDFVSEAGGPDVADQIFRIEPEILRREFKLKSMTLDGKFTIKGPLEEFDRAVKVSPSREEGLVTVSLKGKITGESVSMR